tara:strand:- start:4104 stop:4280 length:177 start_codon:yes stop_codon:yes gene_type:complete
MEFNEVKILVNTALESKDVKEVKKIIDKLAAQRFSYPGALEAIYSGITLKMSQLLNNA